MKLKEEQNLIYLRRILNLYVKFTKAYSEVKVDVVMKSKGWEYTTKKIKDPYTNKMVDIQTGTKDIHFDPTPFVSVVYIEPKINLYAMQQIEFPLSHLPKRIIHYKKKLMKEFKNRHRK
jgi:hypothetical protein